MPVNRNRRNPIFGQQFALGRVSAHVDMVMETTVGKNWRRLFDLLFIDCHKPLFQRANKPFYAYDKSESNLKGDKIKSGAELLAAKP